LTIIAFLYKLISSQFLIRVLSYTIGIFSLFYFEANTLLNSNIPYHWLINFVIYVPIAFYLVKYPEKILKFKFYYLIIYLLFSLHDIYLRTYGYYSSIYGRISIVFGALTIFCYISSLKDTKENLLIKKISKYSLGLFSLHKYWQYLFFLCINNYKLDIVAGIFGIPLSRIFIIEGLLVIFFTILSIYLLKLTPLKQFITS
jgi:hypothetical protein